MNYSLKTHYTSYIGQQTTSALWDQWSRLWCDRVGSDASEGDLWSDPLLFLLCFIAFFPGTARFSVDLLDNAGTFRDFQRATLEDFCSSCEKREDHLAKSRLLQLIAGT